MGFEPTRAETNGLAVHRLNHSATSSTMENKFVLMWYQRLHAMFLRKMQILDRQVLNLWTFSSLALKIP